MRFVATILIALLVNAQIALAHGPRAYFDQPLSGFSEPHLRIDNQAYDANGWKLGAFNISEAMKSNPSALEYALKHETHSTYATIAFWPGLIALFVGAANIENTPGGIAFWGGLAAIIYSGYEASMSRAYLLRAINTYNGVNTSAARPTIDFDKTVRALPKANQNSPLGLSLAWSF